MGASSGPGRTLGTNGSQTGRRQQTGRTCCTSIVLLAPTSHGGHSPWCHRLGLGWRCRGASVWWAWCGQHLQLDARAAAGQGALQRRSPSTRNSGRNRHSPGLEDPQHRTWRQLGQPAPDMPVWGHCRLLGRAGRLRRGGCVEGAPGVGACTGPHQMQGQASQGRPAAPGSPWAVEHCTVVPCTIMPCKTRLPAGSAGAGGPVVRILIV